MAGSQEEGKGRRGDGGTKPGTGSWAAGDVDRGQQGGNVSSSELDVWLTSCAIYLQHHLPTLLFSWYHFEIVASHVSLERVPRPASKIFGGLGAPQKNTPSCQTGSTPGRFPGQFAHYEFARMQQTTTGM